MFTEYQLTQLSRLLAAHEGRLMSKLDDITAIITQMQETEQTIATDVDSALQQIADLKTQLANATTDPNGLSASDAQTVLDKLTATETSLQSVAQKFGPSPTPPAGS